MFLVTSSVVVIGSRNKTFLVGSLTFGDELKLARVELKLARVELARTLGLSILR